MHGVPTFGKRLGELLPLRQPEAVKPLKVRGALDEKTQRDFKAWRREKVNGHVFCWNEACGPRGSLLRSDTCWRAILSRERKAEKSRSIPCPGNKISAYSKGGSRKKKAL